ncbi:MAG: UbiD family decarboxylase [Candidatus Altiarchaeota archaeon]|nr:UbiD family decarboxylase [Candidatus Altiarchaeota archaeon]
MDFRDFLGDLEKNNLLTRHKKPVDPRLEIARILSESQKPVLFDAINGSDYRLVGNICASRETIASYLGVKVKDLLFEMARALDKPVQSEIVKTGKCQEVVEKKVDLNKIPILTHYKNDDGAYITAGICIVNDPKHGRNLSYHRLKRLSENKLVARICERDTYKCMQNTPGETEIAICLGNVPSVLLAAATSLASEVDETTIAGALEKKPIKLVKCKTVDLEVPADCEIVLEGKITKETAGEGMFVDMTGTYDALRQQPVIKVQAVTHRQNPIYQALIPGMTEHRLLMGMPREPTIFKEVNKVCRCTNVNLTPGGCSWLHAVVQIRKKNPDDGRKAIEAAFNGHKSLKMCTVVDDDINLFDPNDVEWALATRFQAHKDLLILERQKGSSLDPSADEEPGTDRRLTDKMGIDATMPSDKDKEEFTRASSM